MCECFASMYMHVYHICAGSGHQNPWNCSYILTDWQKTYLHKALKNKQTNLWAFSSILKIGNSNKPICATSKGSSAEGLWQDRNRDLHKETTTSRNGQS